MKKKASSFASTQKVAIAHDYLREYGGAERVVESLHELYPKAPLYVAFADEKALGIHWPRFKNWELRQSWLSRLPGIRRLYSPLRWLAAPAFESFKLDEFNVVISSSNAYMAKAVRTVPGSVHICYCHTPPRSLYGYTTMSNWQKNKLTHFFGSLINHWQRIVDVRVAQRVDMFVANSEETARRIRRFYNRDSVVIYPPVSLPPQPPARRATSPSTDPHAYYLYVNRLALAKHPEIAVQTANQLGLPLKVVGSGGMLEELKMMAGPTVEFMGAVDDATLHHLYAGATALLYPVEDEDFGIVPIEAMGHGVPVIAHRSGGPRETIKDGVTGVFFDELTVQGMVSAVEKAAKLRFSPTKIYQHAQQFSAETFKKKISSLVATATR